MKILDKSKLFKNAWTLVKKIGMTISAALKLSWVKIKKEVKEYKYIMPKTEMSYEKAIAIIKNAMRKEGIII